MMRAMFSVLIALLVSPALADGEQRAETIAKQESLILVELFTSQGCSSCPPADEVFSRLDALGFTNEDVLPLSFHVDYWNSLGWIDPYSDARWTKRQQGYGRAFQSRQIYTPQLVVHGHVHCVGSNIPVVTQALEVGRNQPNEAQLGLSIDTSDTQWTATVEARWIHEPLPGPDTLVFIAITEDGLSNSVPRGENANRTLSHNAVVRARIPVLHLSEDTDGWVRKTIALELDNDWDRNQLTLALIAQQPGTMNVAGAVRASTNAPPPPKP